MRRDSQNIAFYFAVLLSTSCLLPTAVAQDGSLAKIKQDVRTPYQKVSGVESKQGKASRQHRSIDQDDDDDELGSWFFKTMFFAAAAPRGRFKTIILRPATSSNIRTKMGLRGT